MQNADGGWPYFPGKQSWLEPTAYAALALNGEPAAARAWSLIESWQMPDGAFRPTADVPIPNWTASLCVTLAIARNDLGGTFERAVAWLLGSYGVESSWFNRTSARLGFLNAYRDLSLTGWPWKPNTSSWVEPTAHALIALTQASSKISSAAPRISLDQLRARVRTGEAQLMDIRCNDGGWNYGNREVLGVELPAYPETTGIALAALQHHADLARSLDVAARMAGVEASSARSRLASAWLRIALRLHGIEPRLPLGQPLRDVVVTALDAIGAGPHLELLRAGELS